jgi:hypothetical protein
MRKKASLANGGYRKQFNVKFSYAVEDVAGITVEKPLVILQQTIDYLNSKILLNFKALDNRYVTVSILNKTIFAALSYLKN